MNSSCNVVIDTKGGMVERNESISHIKHLIAKMVHAQETCASMIGFDRKAYHTVEKRKDRMHLPFFSSSG